MPAEFFEVWTANLSGEICRGKIEEKDLLTDRSLGACQTKDITYTMVKDKLL